MCIAQKHFNEFNKWGKPAPLDKNPTDNLLHFIQSSSTSTASWFNVQESLMTILWNTLTSSHLNSYAAMLLKREQLC